MGNMMTDGVIGSRHNNKIKQRQIKESRKLDESTSAVRSTKRTAGVSACGTFAVTQLRALRKSRGRDRMCGSARLVGAVRGVPLQSPPLLGLLRLEAGGYKLERYGRKNCGSDLSRCRWMFAIEFR